MAFPATMFKAAGREGDVTVNDMNKQLRKRAVGTRTARARELQ